MVVCAEIFHDVLLPIGSIGPFTCDRQTPVYSFARTRARRDLSPASSSVGPPPCTKRYPCPRRKRQTTSRLRRQRMPSGTPFSAKSADTSPGPAWCVRTIPEYALGIAEICVAWHRLSTRKTYRLLWRRNAQQRVARRRTIASSSSPRATSSCPPSLCISYVC